MTAEAQTTPAPPPPSDEPPSPPPPSGKQYRKPRIAIGVSILLVVISAYALSLFGVHQLQEAEAPLPPLDLSQGGGDATIVQLRLEELKPVANRLTVNVLVYPGISAYDNRFDVLGTDVGVRLYPTSDLGDLHYPKGKAPAQLSTTVEAHGDPGNWPFDSYRTEPISADAFVGSGDNVKKVPARVEVTGELDGWDVSVQRLHDPGALPTQRGTDNGNVVITFKRAKGPLIFDLGICLVLISLPTLALLVAIPMALGRRKFLPPFATWYAANLFAIVPLRNILPGAPPPGSWIDQAIVQWVLIALVTAMSLYIFAWVRQGD
ncbi:hypothetical protein AWB91_23860 [Mycobacterium paraense]|jgi:hypothetical protein|uniref:DUF4436 domain-containing protein n=1 Tax=Mycobacterium paraense TaxID=767916 RepID=A0A1X2A896_9MYCO|nr:DUF4436 domain-containing protein [Mycobacterium paraense]MCV7444830.1 DUF4436 domain-containing protein [Mycobacterium paraense]ORW29076.1 hypothetical protein AWB91_23860 [Mycobacterium paraense]ORW39061.1 hypothetical protein AWB89_22835 [Mycobacterium paraense]ORW40235.1 hypothetical protein AWB88_12865 [Mycobacterium paraense]ORW44102.1 hypothetical protein AWB90_16355 [Mycobacterium paraense]